MGKISQKINAQVRAMEVAYKEHSFQITISIGGSIYKEGMTKKELVTRADNALYKAKEKGKDQCCLY